MPQNRQAGSSLKEGCCSRRGRPGSLVLFCVAVNTKARAICPHLGALLQAVADAEVNGGSDNGKSGEGTGPCPKQLDEICKLIYKDLF